VIGGDDENYFEIEHNESSPRVFSDSARENISIAQQEYRLSTLDARKQKFLSRSKKIHGDKFDYSKVDFIKESLEVTIICPIHGEFQQIARSHVDGRGCKRCSGVGGLTTEEVVRRFRETIGDKYDYSKVVYESKDEKVIVICPIHGEFETRYYDHWKGKGGCPECRKDKIRKARLGVRTVKVDMEELKDLRSRGYTITEISQKMGVGRGTVQRRLDELKKGVNRNG
tara:strand:+ start:48 stop:728 length:681 start_codon:yes stop_codon:yes gene_type:complete